MLFAIGLGLIGLIFIYFEFFVPGIVMGVIGGLFLFAGLTLSLIEQTALIWSLVYAIGMILLLVFTIRLALWKIRHSQNSSHFYLGGDQEGYQASSFKKELIGKNGSALSDLKPSGHVEIEKQSYQAVSDGQYIKKGSKIKVLRGEGARLIVKEEG